MAAVILLFLAACGTVTQTAKPLTLAKKTVTVQLQAGEQLELGGYTIAVTAITGKQVKLTINQQLLVIGAGEQQALGNAIVEVPSVTDETAQIRITER